MLMLGWSPRQFLEEYFANVRMGRAECQTARGAPPWVQHGAPSGGAQGALLMLQTTTAGTRHALPAASHLQPPETTHLSPRDLCMLRPLDLVGQVR